MLLKNLMKEYDKPIKIQVTGLANFSFETSSLDTFEKVKREVFHKTDMSKDDIIIKLPVKDESMYLFEYGKAIVVQVDETLSAEESRLKEEEEELESELEELEQTSADLSRLKDEKEELKKEIERVREELDDSRKRVKE